MVSFAPNEEGRSDGKLIFMASVLDKTDLPEFVSDIIEVQHEIANRQTDLLSTGGTAKLLRDRDFPVEDVSDFTGAPEMFDGRLKTLHPKVHGGFLERPGVLEDFEAAEANGIKRIGLLAVNLYNFSGAVAKFLKSAKTVEDFAEVMENIDIGGPAMLRSAAKGETTVVMRPEDYGRVVQEMSTNNGDISSDLEAELKTIVFGETHQYDYAIYKFLNANKALYTAYQEAKKAIIAGEREPFECWTKKH